MVVRGPSPRVRHVEQFPRGVIRVPTMYPRRNQRIGRGRLGIEALLDHPSALVIGESFHTAVRNAFAKITGLVKRPGLQHPVARVDDPSSQRVKSEANRAHSRTRPRSSILKSALFETVLKSDSVLIFRDYIASEIIIEGNFTRGIDDPDQVVDLIVRVLN